MKKRDGFYCVMDWMVNDLELNVGDAAVFAIIHGFSQDVSSEYHGGLTYLSKRTRLSKRTIQRILKKLEDSNLITRREIYMYNVKYVNYKVNWEEVNKDRGMDKLSKPMANMAEPMANQSNNNIDYNIEDNIYIKKEKKISFSTDFLNYYNDYLKEFDDNEEKKLKLSKKWDKLSKNKKEKAKKDLAEFSEFWRIYDKKVDKENAFAKFCKTTDEERKEIFRTLPDFVESTPEKKYRKNPATYLYNKVWKNEIIKIEKTYGQKNTSPMAQALTTDPSEYGESTI